MNNYLDLWKSNTWNEFGNINKLMDRMLRDPYSTLKYKELAQFNPNCEVTENKNQYIMKFEVPGIPKDQIKIELDENRLTVSGSKKEEKKEEDKDKKTHFSEMNYGSFMRTFTLPTPVNAEKVMATYDHGVLTVTLEKSEASRTRQIAIK